MLIFKYLKPSTYLQKLNFLKMVQTNSDFWYSIFEFEVILTKHLAICNQVAGWPS